MEYASSEPTSEPCQSIRDRCDRTPIDTLAEAMTEAQIATVDDSGTLPVQQATPARQEVGQSGMIPTDGRRKVVRNLYIAAKRQQRSAAH